MYGDVYMVSKRSKDFADTLRISCSRQSSYRVFVRGGFVLVRRHLSDGICTDEGGMHLIGAFVFVLHSTGKKPARVLLVLQLKFNFCTYMKCDVAVEIRQKQ